MYVGVVGSKDRVLDSDKDLIRGIITSYPKDTIFVSDGTREIGAFVEQECERQGLHFIKFSCKIRFPDTRYNRALYTRAMRHRNESVTSFVDKLHVLVNQERKGSAESYVRFAKELKKELVIEEVEGANNAGDQSEVEPRGV